MDGIGEVGDWASEGQAAGVYGAGFTAGSLAGKGARVGRGGWGTRLVLTRSESRLGGWRNVTEGGQGRRLRVEESDRRMR